MRKVFLSLATVAVLMTSCGQKTTNDKCDNPFFTEWDHNSSTYGLPPFEQIQVSHYLPAFEAGIKAQQEEINAIITNAEAPTFDNVIAAMDRSGQLLAKVAGVYFNLTESDGTEELKAIQNDILGMVSTHSDNIYMNADLFKKVEAVYAQKDDLNLTKEQTTLLNKVYKTFVRNGIALPADKQAIMRDLNSKISTLQQKFGNNMLAETNAFQLVLETEEELAGLPEGLRVAASEAAKNAGMEGKYLFGLQSPSYLPFMQYSERRDLREKMYKGYTMRGNNNNENDNKSVVMDLIKLRIERANLLGYESPADFILEETMAKTSDAVNSFLKDIFVPANEKAKEELAEMQKIADAEGFGDKLQAWDWSYYAEKLRIAKYAMNEDEIKPYFSMENTRKGIFSLANKLWGLNFEHLDGMPLYNPEAECFKVTDADGALIGLFYTDYYPRATKRGGAWMTNFREQRVIDGVDVRPVVINIGNFTAPTANTPSLLTLDEVTTLFHEFGHALHGLFAKSNYVSVTGTNVQRDFVELPSQILENWAFEPEVLAMYAFHYETGEPIPAELVEKINSTGTFNQGFMTTELSAAAILDMYWHDLTSEDLAKITCPMEFEKQVTEKIGLIPEICCRYRTTYFNHIWAGGYSAGYYSYLWAEVLDKDAFAYFKEKGIFNQEIAAKFRTLLEKGGSEDGMDIYREFRGQEPNPEAMLIGRGLK